MAEGVSVFIDTKEEYSFKPTKEKLKKANTPKTKALVLNNPDNPHSWVYDRAELAAIADLAVERGFFIISDEIYEELVYDGMQHVSIASLNEEVKALTITINGMSKAYAMTGWRIGYAAGPKQVIKIMGNIQSHATSNPNSIAQYASTVALDTSKDEIKGMVEEFNRRRLYMANRINDIPHLSCRLPKGAFYVMMNIKDAIGKKHGNTLIDGSLAFADALLNVQKVTVVPGIAFGADNFVRLSYAISMEQIQKGLDRIEQFMTELS